MKDFLTVMIAILSPSPGRNDTLGIVDIKAKIFRKTFIKRLDKSQILVYN